MEGEKKSNFLERKKENYKRWYNSSKGKAYRQKKLKEKTEANCATCNNIFKRRDNRQIFCSKKCVIKTCKPSDLHRKTKKCNSCKEVLSIDDFSLADRYGTRRGKCKLCYKEHIQKIKGTLDEYKKEKLYRKELHDLQIENKRRCRICNIIKSLDDFHTTNSVKAFYNKKTYCKKCARSEYARPYLQSLQGKEKKSKWDKKYRSKSEVIQRINEKHIERYYNDPCYKILHTLRGRMKVVFKSKNLLKKNSTIELLGCTVREAIEHIEKQFKEGMTWKNHSVKGWHIDHIRPCSSFDLTDPEQQKQCFNYKNLQPLWAKDNLSKNDRLDWEPPSMK